MKLFISLAELKRLCESLLGATQMTSLKIPCSTESRGHEESAGRL